MHYFSSVVGHCDLKFAYFSGLTLFCDRVPTEENLNSVELLSVLEKKNLNIETSFSGQKE